jgi:hypothetical protein
VILLKDIAQDTQMPMLALKIFVIILAVLTMIHIIGEWIDRRKRQKRTATPQDLD